jgi:hypothetical protein
VSSVPDRIGEIVYIDRKEVSMDANEITCPKCGHLNNYISEGCVKCGIIFSNYFAMQEREQQPEGVAAPEVAGKPEATQAAVAAGRPASAGSEAEPFEATVTMDLNTLSSESQDPPAAEAAPVEKKAAPESTEISMAEIEIPAESETVESETPPEIRAESPEAEPKKTGPSGAPEAVAAEKAAPAEASADKIKSADQISEIKNEETPQTAKPLDEKTPQAEKSDVAATAAKVRDLGEPLGQEKDNVIPLNAEPKPQKPEAPITPDQSVDKKDGPDQAQAESTPVAASAAEPAPESAAAVVDTPPAEDEAEILLEEVAQPVNAGAAAAEADAAGPRAGAAGAEAADQNRAELLKKQKAALAKAAIAKKQKLAQAKKLEALKKQKIAQAKAEALKRQKAAALKKQKLQARAEALKKQKAAQAEAESLTQETQAAVNAPAEIQPLAMAKSEVSKMKIMGLLKKYEGKTIGINYDNSADIKEAELVEANDEFFSVMVKETNLQYSYPLQTLLSLIEGEDGVQPDTSESKTKYSAVIKIYPLVLF